MNTKNSKPATSNTVENTPAKGERLIAYSIKATGEGASIWSQCGSAFINRDGSINVYLDVLPLDGKLHIRRAHSQPDTGPEAKTDANAN